VIGRHVEFGEVPAGLKALENRETTGRNVITLH
jgi:hypothetical protein